MAARVGRFGGLVLIAIGAVEFLAGGGALGGIWLVVIGWFIVMAAGQQRDVYARGTQPPVLRVREAMTHDPEGSAAGRVLALEGERLVGILTGSDIRRAMTRAPHFGEAQKSTRPACAWGSGAPLMTAPILTVPLTGSDVDPAE